MTALLLALSLLQAPVAERRTLLVSVTDDKGVPIEGLSADEVAVLENGVARELLQLEYDRRPLTLVMIVDSSHEAASSFRLHVVEAVSSFLARLPAGSRYALWTTGDRPTKLVDFTDDTVQAGRALRRVFPQGGNLLLDTLVEASRELKQREGERTAVVTVSGMGIGFANYDRSQVVREAESSRAVFLSVLFDEGSAPAGPGDLDRVSRMDYEHVLTNLAASSGGRHEPTLSAMGVSGLLRKLGSDIRGQYRLSYAAVPGTKDRKLEVQVARPGAQVRVGVPNQAAP